jgi:hypothetical protein
MRANSDECAATTAILRAFGNYKGLKPSSILRVSEPCKALRNTLSLIPPNPLFWTRLLRYIRPSAMVLLKKKIVLAFAVF